MIVHPFAHTMGSFSARPRKHDLDDVTRIIVAGSTEEPEVHYRYPLRDQYPEDYWNWTKKEYEGYLEQPDKFVLHILSVPVASDGKVTMVPVGLAVWDIAVMTKANGTGPCDSCDLFL